MNAQVPAILFTANPVEVLTTRDENGNPSAFEAMLKTIAAEIDATPVDLSTETGRKKVKSLAYKITQTKTAIDDARKSLNEEANNKIKAVNAVGNVIWDRLEELAKSVKAPVTVWEEEQKAREEFKAKTLADLRAIDARPGSSSADIFALIETTKAFTLDADVLADQYDPAIAAKEVALVRLGEALQRAEKAEADIKELEELRALRTANEAKEIERLANEKAEADRIENERLENERIANAAAEATRLANEAAEAARIEEHRKAEAALAEERRVAQEKIDEADARALKIEQDAQTERNRIAAEEQKKKDDQTAREADAVHRAKVMSDASSALMLLGTPLETASKIVLAIVKGEIPNVTLKF